MKITLAQIKPIKGKIAANIIQHKKWIHLAIANQADLIIFPELSITGYEPTLAANLAISPSDSRFADFQELSNQHAIIIGIGAPIQKEQGINIGLLLFHPNQPRQIYAKKYLHVDELPFFVEGKNEEVLIRGTDIALAICYELSVAKHAISAAKNGAKMYIASVAKTESGVLHSEKRLSKIANDYSMPTLMVNCFGYFDDFESVGQSAAWDKEGKLLKQLESRKEGLLIYDTSDKIACAKGILP